MLGFVASISPIWSLGEQSADFHELLKTAVKDFVSESRDISTQQVSLKPLHPSFSPPNCPEKFLVSFFQESETSLLVECRSLKWKSYVSVYIKEIRDVSVYTESFKRGYPLKNTDLILERMEGELAGPIIERDNLGLVVLKRDVIRGQIAFAKDIEKAVVVHKLMRNLEKKSKLDLKSIKQILVAESRTTHAQIFPRKLLSGSVASRNLRAGRVLTRSDFNELKSALFVTENIPYGGLIDESNTELRSTNERIPTNNVYNLQKLGRVQATRLLRSDTLLRLSDVRPAPLVRLGETATLSIDKGSLNINVKLIAQENGLMGDLIRLKNPDSGENVVGRVVGVGKVTLPN